jgi:putative transposase
MLSSMLVRYRYRIDPTPGRRRALARALGCARVVYNDALAERQRAFAAGEKLSDSEVQRRVVTLAKKTPERAWLAEVASVALVQACQDARRAYRNWFDSLSGAQGPPSRAAQVPRQARPPVDTAHAKRVQRAPGRPALRR